VTPTTGHRHPSPRPRVRDHALHHVAARRAVQPPRPPSLPRWRVSGGRVPGRRPARPLRSGRWKRPRRQRSSVGRLDQGRLWPCARGRGLGQPLPQGSHRGWVVGAAPDEWRDDVCVGSRKWVACHVSGVECVEDRFGHDGNPCAGGDAGHDGVVRGELENACPLEAAGPEPPLEILKAMVSPARTEMRSA